MNEDPEVELAFINYRATYQKSYSSKIEYLARFENFKKVFYMIKEHNSNSERTYDMGINRHADRFENEFGLNKNAKIPVLEESLSQNFSTAVSFSYPKAGVNWKGTKYDASVKD